MRSVVAGVCPIIEESGSQCVDYDRWPARLLASRHDLHAFKTFLTSPLLLLCSDPLSQKLWSVESGKALLRISAKFGPPSGPFSRDSSGEKITISIRVCGAVYRSLSAQIMAPDTIGRPSQFGKIVLTVF